MGTGQTQRKVDTICRYKKRGMKVAADGIMIYKTGKAFLPHGVM